MTYSFLLIQKLTLYESCHKLNRTYPLVDLNKTYKVSYQKMKLKLLHIHTRPFMAIKADKRTLTNIECLYIKIMKYRIKAKFYLFQSQKKNT